MKVDKIGAKVSGILFITTEVRKIDELSHFSLTGNNISAGSRPTLLLAEIMNARERNFCTELQRRKNRAVWT